MRFSVLTVLAALVALAAALVALAASGPASTAPTTRNHYHLYPGDVVDVGGGPHFDWSCTLYRLGPSARHALGNRVFECRGGAEWTRPEPHLLLRVVVFQD